MTDGPRVPQTPASAPPDTSAAQTPDTTPSRRGQIQLRLPCTCGAGPGGEEPDFRPGCPMDGHGDWTVDNRGRLLVTLDDGYLLLIAHPGVAGWLGRQLAELADLRDYAARAAVPPF